MSVYHSNINTVYTSKMQRMNVAWEVNNAVKSNRLQ